MSEWVTIQLKELLTLKRGYDLPHSETKSGPYPVVASTNVRGYHNEYKVDGPVITVGRSGSIGHVQYIESKAWPLNTTLYMTDAKGNNKRFIYYFLKTIGLEQFNSGAGVPTLNRNHINLLKVKIPKNTIQTKISDVLSTYDKLIENNNRRMKILEQTAEELYKEWFVRMRFPGYEKTKFDKGIPEGWEVTKFINENCELIPSGVKRYDNLKQYIATADVNELEISNGEYFDYKNRPSRANMEPKVNSLWFAKMADSRKHMYIIEENFYIYCNYIFSTGFAGISCKKEYFYYYLSFIRYGGFEELKDSYANGATQVAINNDNIKRIPILIPELKLIERFNAIVKDIYIEISKLQKSSKILMKNRDLLLPRLMNGTIIVK